MDKLITMNNNIEIRKTQHITSNERKVSGYAVLFNSQSEDIGFFETIEPSAIDEETIKRSDIFAKFNHDDDKILARSKYGEGSLSLTIDDKGLYYQFEAPNNIWGDALLEHLRRNEITSSSFAFTVANGGDKWEKRNGIMYRTISKIDNLFDVSPVFQPAYSNTTCTQRNLDNAKKIFEINEKLDEMEAEILLM